MSDNRGLRSIDGGKLPDPPTITERVAAGELDPAEDYNTYPAPVFPMAVARRLKQELFMRGEHSTLVRWRGDFWQYTGTHWEEVEDILDVKEPIWERLEQVTFGNEDEPKPWAPNAAKIEGLMEPLAIRCRIPNGTEAPAWVDQDGTRDATGTISMNNGILDLADRTLDQHTPAHFSTWVLDFDFNHTATCPTWQAFLKQVFSHDPNGALLLQEYAGYLISGRTDMHKALVVIGPPRAGKGIISGILQKLMGTANVATTTFHDLAGEFGLKPLVGKPMAVIEDARGDDSRRSNLAVERLLNIIANDPVSVNRKNRDFWNGRLNTRMVLVSNEVPRFKDASGAILTRFVMVKLAQSFVGREDVHLGDKLAAELPGIFNWALDGLARLNQQGAFTEAATHEELRDVMKDMAQPLEMFIDETEEFEITNNPADYVKLRGVHSAYQEWAKRAERAAMNQESFQQAITAAFPGISAKNTVPEEGVKKNRFLFGVRAIERKGFGTWG